MDVNKLIRMANQIAANFDTGEAPEKSARAVSDHLRKYWGSPMKREIVEHYRQGKPGLSDVAAAAVAHLAEEQDSAA